MKIRECRGWFCGRNLITEVGILLKFFSTQMVPSSEEKFYWTEDKELLSDHQVACSALTWPDQPADWADQPTSNQQIPRLWNAWLSPPASGSSDASFPRNTFSLHFIRSFHFICSMRVGRFWQPWPPPSPLLLIPFPPSRRFTWLRRVDKLSVDEILLKIPPFKKRKNKISSFNIIQGCV